MKKIRSGALLLAVCLLMRTGLTAIAAEQPRMEAAEKTAQTAAQTAAQTMDRDTRITARVASAEPSYYLTLPGSIALGDLDATKDYRREYQIGVHVDQPGGLKLKITSDREITYKNADDPSKQLKGYNSFGTQYFEADGEANGTLTVYKEDISRVPKGSYTGRINFYTTFVSENNQDMDGTGGQDKSDTSGNVKDQDKNETTQTERTVRAHVLMEQYGQIKPSREESMCWPFFHQNAELSLRKDGQVDVTMYLIDPIPGENFKKYGIPLEHLYVTGNSADITVENLGAVPGDPNSPVTLKPDEGSYGMETDIDSATLVTKTFVKDKSGGVFVPADGEYPSVPVRFTVPLSAVRESANGTILLTGYIRPMTVWKQFFLVFDDADDFGENTGSDEIKTGYQIEKSEIPSAGVNGLKDYAEKAGDGTYILTIRNANSSKDAAGISQIAMLIAAGASGGNVSYYDISMARKTDEETTAVTDLEDSVLEIRLPLSADKGKKLAVYRSHDGNVGLMQELTARRTAGYMDNTYYADWTGGYLYLYTSKFSVYGICQSAAGSTGGNTNNGSNSGQTSNSGSLSGDSSTNSSYTAQFSIRKYDDIDSLSMCAPMFYSKADLKVNGDSTKVTIYVINPIPNYAEYGTPLSNIRITANESNYSASLNTKSKVSRYFDYSDQFIPESGNYYASPITFTIPTSAVEDSADGTVKMTAYVNAVMKSTQEFYLVFSDWESGATKSSGKATTIETTSGSSETTAASGTSSTTASSETTAASAESAGASTDISGEAAANGTPGVTEYLIPVTALKEKTNESSMMADYMYQNARLRVSGDTRKLTVYVQHTVAGITGGGPEWISYNGTKAVKQVNAVKYGGVSYDSFTFTLSGDVPSTMMVTMYINAMKMEVKARLVFDLAKKTLVSTTSSGGSGSSGSSGGAGGTGTSSFKTAAGQAAEELILDEAEETLPEETETEESSGTGKTSRTSSGKKNAADSGRADAVSAGYELITDAGIVSIMFLGLTVLAGGIVIWLRRRNRRD